MGKATVKEKEEYSILSCINCIGVHPDETITMMTVISRMKNPIETVHRQFAKYTKKKDLYKNKSCMLCGRTYNGNGELDETWELTAKRVKIEFDAAGVPGVDDAYIKQVVASCIKSWKILWKNRATIKPEDAEKMTFCGRLALIITHAQDSRMKRNQLNSGKKGIVT